MSKDLDSVEFIVLSHFFCFWAIPSRTPGLLLVLSSGMTLGQALVTIWEAGDKIWVSEVHDKCPYCCTFASIPNHLISEP